VEIDACCMPVVGGVWCSVILSLSRSDLILGSLGVSPLFPPFTDEWQTKHLERPLGLHFSSPVGEQTEGEEKDEGETRKREKNGPVSKAHVAPNSALIIGARGEI
jgi:hypothetical protein